jgi:membrane associated rhomboid family serine protease
MRYRTNEGEHTPIIALIIINFLVYIFVNIAGFSGLDISRSIIPNLGLSLAGFSHHPWTVVSYMFTHTDFWHLLLNMITLYFFGSFLNRLIGLRRFLAVYFIGGLIGGLFVLLFSWPPFGSPYIPTIGASGAIFALGGALAVLTPKLKVIIFPIPVPMPLWVAILVSFLVLAFLPNVSWQGHLGGLLFGLLAGWFLRKRVRVIY